RGGSVQGFYGPEQGSFKVQGFAGIRNKNGGNTERAPHSQIQYESGRRRIPGGIAPGFEGRPQSAVRQAGSIGFLLYERIAVKIFNGCSVITDTEKSVVFFSRCAGQRLKPVRIMTHTFVDGPCPHS